jgi:multisubunit Na+/H+ antiporter MnhE subunit
MAGMVLVTGTAFSLLTGLDSTLDFVHGAVWRDVTVTNVRGITFAAGSQRITPSILTVDLAGGHTLRTVEGVEPRKGAARMLLLEGLGRILAAER